MDWTEKTLSSLRDKQESWVLGQAGVQGTGVGLDRSGALAIIVYSHLLDELTRERIRKRFAGAPVYFEETGPIEAQ